MGHVKAQGLVPREIALQIRHNSRIRRDYHALTKNDVDDAAVSISTPRDEACGITIRHFWGDEMLLLQFRRRRAIEHAALRPLEQIESVGFDHQRPAHALEFGDLFDFCKIFFLIRPPAGSRLVDI